MIPTLPPLAILEGKDAYETRDCKCARCAKLLPNAPWCVKSPELKHRPRCPYCGSSAIYPLALAVEPKRRIVAEVVNKNDP
jgi:DNA-directed RNA polymerase subunit RPC12/RpoP